MPETHELQHVISVRLQVFIVPCLPVHHIVYVLLLVRRQVLHAVFEKVEAVVLSGRAEFLEDQPDAAFSVEPAPDDRPRRDEDLFQAGRPVVVWALLSQRERERSRKRDMRERDVIAQFALEVASPEGLPHLLTEHDRIVVALVARRHIDIPVEAAMLQNGHVHGRLYDAGVSASRDLYVHVMRDRFDIAPVFERDRPDLSGAARLYAEFDPASGCFYLKELCPRGPAVDDLRNVESADLPSEVPLLHIGSDGLAAAPRLGHGLRNCLCREHIRELPVVQFLQPLASLFIEAGLVEDRNVVLSEAPCEYVHVEASRDLAAVDHPARLFSVEGKVLYHQPLACACRVAAVSAAVKHVAHQI